MPTEPFHRLFFAIRPPAALIPEIAALRGSLGQTKSLVPDEQLHLTTWLFEDSKDYPVVAAMDATAAAEAVPLTAFHMILDRIVGGKGHVLLVPSEAPQGFIAFQKRLDTVLRLAGLAPRPNWRFSPHLTLLHGRHDIDAPIEAISWIAQELLLIDSIVGRRRHDVIARVALV